VNASYPLVAVLAGVALTLTGCTGAEPADPSTPPASATPSGPRPDDVIATRILPIDGKDVEARVYPLVRVGAHVVLTMDLVAPPMGEGEDVFVSDTFGDADPTQSGATALRLLDLEADVVHKPAVDAEGSTVGTRTGGWENIKSGRTMRLQVAYAAPAADEVALLLPTADLVDAVPVLDAALPAADPPGPTPTATAASAASGSPTSGSPTPTPSRTPTPQIDLAAVVTAEVLPLETFTHQLESDVRTAQAPDRITVALGSDVLFASESADLTPEAQAAIELAVAQLRTHGAGTVSVVGHTDSVADDASNQALSERRAASVAAALAPLLDAGAYPLEVSGRGEQEPLTSNDTDLGRQSNRRVELVLVSERTADEAAAATVELPPAPPLTTTGAEGVVLQGGPFDYRVRAPRARLVQGHLVLSVEVTNETGGEASGWGPNFFEGWGRARGGTVHPLAQSMSGMVVLQGSTAVHPLDYPVGWNDDVIHTCACETGTKAQIDGGQTATYTAVYPVLGNPDTIAVQRGQEPYSEDSHFRLTDIPVEQG
jgi:OOP family OmpA-OmpF porin